MEGGIGWRGDKAEGSGVGGGDAVERGGGVGGDAYDVWYLTYYYRFW